MICAAVVVTYNRLALLKENLNALLSQTSSCDIILVDNASTDGTQQYVESMNEIKIKYFNTGSNLGGAGGFSYGVAIGEQMGYKYLWIMDDDAVPEPDALESLLRKAEAIKGDFSYLCSLVFWTDGNLFPMNIPNIRYKKGTDARCDLIRTYHIMPVNSASFVGCFINTDISRSSGLPISEFFIYGDDVEYTSRLRKEKAAYLDLDSVIIHKAPSITGADIATASEDRIDRFYYQSRNGIYLAKKRGVLGVLKRMKIIFKRSVAILTTDNKKKMKRLLVLYKGSLAGIFFNPEIRYSKNLEIQELARGGEYKLKYRIVSPSLADLFLKRSSLKGRYEYAC